MSTAGTATISMTATLSALSANLPSLLAALQGLSLPLQTAVKGGRFAVIITLLNVSRADYDTLKTALAAFEAPASPLPVSFVYSELG